MFGHDKRNGTISRIISGVVALEYGIWREAMHIISLKSKPQSATCAYSYVCYALPRERLQRVRFASGGKKRMQNIWHSVYMYICKLGWHIVAGWLKTTDTRLLRWHNIYTPDIERWRVFWRGIGREKGGQSFNHFVPYVRTERRRQQSRIN